MPKQEQGIHSLSLQPQPGGPPHYQHLNTECEEPAKHQPRHLLPIEHPPNELLSALPKGLSRGANTVGDSRDHRPGEEELVPGVAIPHQNHPDDEFEAESADCAQTVDFENTKQTNQLGVLLLDREESLLGKPNADGFE